MKINVMYKIKKNVGNVYRLGILFYIEGDYGYIISENTATIVKVALSDIKVRDSDYQ